MKQIINKILLIILIFATVTCKDSPTESNRVIKDPSYSISGIVYDVVSSDYSPGVKKGKGAVIYLDKDSTFSDEEGKFTFNKVTKGDHTISITLPNYEPYSKTISVLRDTSIAIYLYGIIGDYFPIQENFYKKFKYYNGVSTLVYSWTDQGEAVWVISSIKQESNSKLYEVTETIIFTHKVTAPLNSETVDTTISTFYINESSSNIISFKSSVLDGVSFSRYNDMRLGEVITKTFTNPGSLISTINIYLKKNVGLTKIVQFGSGGRWSKTYELIGQ